MTIPDIAQTLFFTQLHQFYHCTSLVKDLPGSTNLSPAQPILLQSISVLIRGIKLCQEVHKCPRIQKPRLIRRHIPSQMIMIYGRFWTLILLFLVRKMLLLIFSLSSQLLALYIPFTNVTLLSTASHIFARHTTHLIILSPILKQLHNTIRPKTQDIWGGRDLMDHQVQFPSLHKLTERHLKSSKVFCLNNYIRKLFQNHTPFHIISSLNLFASLYLFILMSVLSVSLIALLLVNQKHHIPSQSMFYCVEQLNLF